MNEIKQFIKLLILFTEQYLILKYRRSVFGVFLSTLNPIFMILVTSLVFSSLLNKDLIEHFLYIFSGMICWNLINQTIFSSSNSFLINEGLIKKIHFGLFYIPLGTFFGVLIDNILLILILIFCLFIFSEVHIVLIYLIPAYIIFTFFCIGCSLFISTLTIFYRDAQWVVGILLQTLFFLTPVMYKMNDLTHLSTFIKFNPLSSLVLLTNNIFNGFIPSIDIWIAAAISSLSMFLFGFTYYYFNQFKIIYRF